MNYTLDQTLFFVIADEDNLFYSPFLNAEGKKKREAEERMRAIFLVSLIEEKGFNQDDIRLDVEASHCDIYDSIDLVAFKEDLPFLAVDFLWEKASLGEIKEAREKLLLKAKAIKAKEAVLVSGKTERSVFRN